MSEISVDRLAAVYIKIRDARQVLKKSYDEEDAVLEKQMDMVKNELLSICKTTGAESLRTKSGTVTRSVQTRYYVSDWGSMYEFIKEHDAPQLLEQRIHQGNMKQFLNSNPDEMPKGMNMSSQYSISVRKSN